MARRKRSAEETADKITDYYRMKFGGKGKGRFTFTREHFRLLSGRRKLTDAYISAVDEEIRQFGFLLIEHGDLFAILDDAVLDNWRKLPKALVNENLPDDGDDDDEDSGGAAEEPEYEESDSE